MVRNVIDSNTAYQFGKEAAGLQGPTPSSAYAQSKQHIGSSIPTGGMGGGSKAMFSSGVNQSNVGGKLRDSMGGGPGILRRPSSYMGGGGSSTGRYPKVYAGPQGGAAGKGGVVGARQPGRANSISNFASAMNAPGSDQLGRAMSRLVGRASATRQSDRPVKHFTAQEGYTPIVGGKAIGAGQGVASQKQDDGSYKVVSMGGYKPQMGPGKPTMIPTPIPGVSLPVPGNMLAHVGRAAKTYGNQFMASRDKSPGSFRGGVAGLTNPNKIRTSQKERYMTMARENQRANAQAKADSDYAMEQLSDSTSGRHDPETRAAGRADYVASERNARIKSVRDRMAAHKKKQLQLLYGNISDRPAGYGFDDFRSTV